MPVELTRQSAPFWDRAAEIGDAEAVARFLAERFDATFGHTYRPQDLAAFLAQTYAAERLAEEIADPSSALRLAFSGNASERPTLMAVAHVGPMGLPFDHPESEEAAELKRLYLADAAKGTGIADRLMAWAFDWARGRGAQAMYLGVWSENERAKRFYARFGFRQVGAYQFVVGEARDDEWILRSPL